MVNPHHNISIVIPAYNEGSKLITVLHDLDLVISLYSYKVIVVNDGSTDNTATLLEQFKSENPNYPLIVVTHRLNRGYGAALKSGIRAVDTPYVITFDADGQHPKESIIALFERLVQDDADLCIGNRNYQGSNFWRNMVKRLMLFAVKTITGVKISDLNSGMKLYKRDVVKSLIKFAPDGMPFSDTIVLLHHQFRYKITQTDIAIKKREQGISTVNYRTAISTLGEVTNLIINFYPFKFFVYCAALLFLFAGIWGTPLIIAGKGLSTGTSFLLLSGILCLFFGLVLNNVVRQRFENYDYTFYDKHS